MTIPVPTPIYHITHVENLVGILDEGRLTCKSHLGSQHVSIAHGHIQDRRARVSIPVGPGGTLPDYVPFYFCYRSPMLYAVKTGQVAGYQGGQEAVIYLVSSVQSVESACLRCVFTDRHAVLEYASFYTDLADLVYVDWEMVAARWWFNSPEHPQRKERKQAEFLVHGVFPWAEVEEIAVMTATTKRRVEQILVRAPETLQRPVRVRRDWYY